MLKTEEKNLVLGRIVKLDKRFENIVPNDQDRLPLETL